MYLAQAIYRLNVGLEANTLITFIVTKDRTTNKVPI
jgi:hypothetical protein